MSTQVEQVEDRGVNPASERGPKMGITRNFAHPSPCM